jgi:hypothetical protein
VPPFFFTGEYLFLKVFYLDVMLVLCCETKLVLLEFPMDMSSLFHLAVERRNFISAFPQGDLVIVSPSGGNKKL